MSELRLRKIQLGADTQNPENNITIETPSISDGTMKIRTGSAQGTGTDIFTFADGQVENFNTNNLSIGGTQVLDSNRNLSNVSIAYDNGISGLSANSVQAALDELTVLTGGGNIGSQANFERVDFTATAGQTVFDLDPKTYDPGYIQVFLNGVLLASDEIVASNGTTVELVEPALDGQLVSVVVLDSFDIATQLRVLDISASAPDDAVTVSSNGSLGIGTTVPTDTIHVSKTSFPTLKLTDTTDNASLLVQYHSSTNQHRITGIGDFPLIFKTNDIERIRITNNGTLQLTNSPGIDFQSGGTSSTLDDYEEGTWTPSLIYSGSTSGVVGSFTGHYTKIGNLVRCQVTIFLSSKGTGSGSVRIGGLPFTPSPGDSGRGGGPCTGLANINNITGIPFAQIEGGQSEIIIRSFDQSSQTDPLLDISNIKDNFIILFDLSYATD